MEGPENRRIITKLGFQYRKKIGYGQKRGAKNILNK